MSDTTVPRLTGAARTSRRRAVARDRKRRQRSSEAERGRPTLDVLDRAVVDALRGLLLAAPEGERYNRPIRPDALILAVGGFLVKRSIRDRAAGRDVVAYKREEVAKAIEARLFSTPRARREGALPEV